MNRGVTILLATTGGGLFRSEDQGSTWARVTGGVPYSDITGLAIHPDGRTIYVRADKGNLYMPDSLERARSMIAVMKHSHEQIMSDPGNLFRPGALEAIAKASGS